MTTEDIIIQIFCLVDDHLKEVPKHRQAKLYPSELVTIGLLFAALQEVTFAPFIAGSNETMTPCLAGCPIAPACNGCW